MEGNNTNGEDPNNPDEPMDLNGPSSDEEGEEDDDEDLRMCSLEDDDDMDEEYSEDEDNNEVEEEEDSEVDIDEMNEVQGPILISDESGYEVWFKPLEESKVIEGQLGLILNFWSPSSNDSVEANAYTSIFLEILKAQMTGANPESFTTSLEETNSGFQFKVQGPKNGFLPFLNVLLGQFKSFPDGISERTFTLVKNAFTVQLLARVVDPAKLIQNLLYQVAHPNFDLDLDLCNAVGHGTFEGLKEQVNMFKNRLYLRLCFQGDLTQEEALETSKELLEGIGGKRISKLCFQSHQRMVRWPRSTHQIRLDNFNVHDPRTIVLSATEVGHSRPKHHGYAHLITVALNNFLEENREKPAAQNFGMRARVESPKGILILILETMYLAKEFHHERGRARRRVRNILQSFAAEVLEKMNDETLQKIKGDLMARILPQGLTPQQINELELQRYGKFLKDVDMEFTRHHLIIEALKDIQSDGLLRWFKANYLEDDENADESRRIIIEVKGNPNIEYSAGPDPTIPLNIFENSPSEKGIQGLVDDLKLKLKDWNCSEAIKDISSFKMGLPTWEVQLPE